jgi:ArsR family transcriptional regulator, arsenate/arsenite/antimonite-responsive transcriptional repressor
MSQHWNNPPLGAAAPDVIRLSSVGSRSQDHLPVSVAADESPTPPWPSIRLVAGPSAPVRSSGHPSSGVWLPDDEAVTKFAEHSSALSSATRVRLALILCKHPAGTESGRVLAASIGLSETTVSHHLRRLRRAGLIESQRRGMSVFHIPSAELRLMCGALVHGEYQKRLQH